MPLPRPPALHPGSGKPRNYVNFRRAKQYQYIKSKVIESVEPKLPSIQKLPTWEEKQDAIDELFENTEFEIKDEEQVLGKHPKFGNWVEKALEEYLEAVQKEDGDEPAEVDPDEAAVPVFVDLHDEDSEEESIPKIVFPISSHKENGAGRMLEEWELAAHETAKRVMLRQSTRQIAKTLHENTVSRVFVSGAQGTGKTAALMTIVASARKSGQIVLYLPDGDRLRKHGFYIEPNSKIPGLYDIPLLSQEICGQLLESHEDDLEGIMVDEATRNKFVTDDQIEKIPEEYQNELSVVGLLKMAQELTQFAPMCYASVIETLMNQDDKSFLVVLDEFNCYYDHGHYFHMDYDKSVRSAIPLNQITLLKPFLDAMGLSTADDDEVLTPVAMKKGGIVVGVTESRAVARRFTDSLVASAEKTASLSPDDCPLEFVTVSRYSDLEVDHILSNFEIVGVGRLRFDQGDTVLNENEVAYLRMVSGSTGQKLLDACVI